MSFDLGNVALVIPCPAAAAPKVLAAAQAVLADYAAPENGGPAIPSDAEIEAVYVRQRKYDARTESPRVVAALRQDGWDAIAGQARTPGGRPPAYVRVVFHGRDLTVSGYVTTTAIAFAQEPVMTFARKHLKDAVIRSSGAYLYHANGGVEKALAGAAAIAQWADGKSWR